MLKKVKIVEENILDTYPVGAMVKNSSYGRGVVVGYSSLTGNPVVFFYIDEIPRCVDVIDINYDDYQNIDDLINENKEVVIDGKLFNLNTSECLGIHDIPCIKSAFEIFNRTILLKFKGELYKSKKGNFFMIGEEKRKITVSEKYIKDYFMNNDYYMYKKLFGELEEA